jgi:serine/threonine protein kinase/DNA-binding winged helix-turn-helix (wHTH) protein
MIALANGHWDDSLHHPLLCVLMEFSRTLKKAKCMIHNGSQVNVQESSGRLWRFADCEFDELSLQLRVKGQVVDLELKPLEVLLQLLVHAGEVITKDELLDSVWPGLTVVDGSLATAMSKLRRALGDENSTVVLTVPRVGYRLAVPVHSKPLGALNPWAELGLKDGNSVPGREHWRLARRLEVSASSEVWLAEHPKTHEQRVFKFASNLARLKGLKREVTVARFLRESLGERPEFVRLLEWNFDTPPHFLESEYGGPNLAEWAKSQGGLIQTPLETRIRLIADVAKAVAEAHEVGVLHKDLKPTNILVTTGGGGKWQIKVADFGSASLVEPSRLKALGITNLGLTQTGGPQTPSLTGTLMYLAPEVLSGQSPTAPADVYSLGVMLYQIVIGDFRKPLAPGWEAEIEDSLIRQDIADAACGDPTRRITNAAGLAERLLNLDPRRKERDALEEAARHARIVERKQAEARARRPWILAASLALLVGLLVSLSLYRKVSGHSSGMRTVAVLPFQNVGSDHSLDFLQLALPDEVATTLSHTRSISIRPFTSTRKYTDPVLDAQKMGREMQVTTIVTGNFLRAGEQLQITLEAIDVETNRSLWRNTFNLSAQNLIAMQGQISTQAQVGLASALGASALTADPVTRPTNEEAYDLYLRSAAVPDGPDSDKQAIGMLEKSVGLDPNYAPAWISLGRRYYTEARFESQTGDEVMMERFQVATERALALDPNSIIAGAGLALRSTEQGQLAKGYQQAADLVRRRPDSADAHFILSYVLRYAGLTEEAAKQCDIAFSLDPHTQTNLLRSCAMVFVARGDYPRAMNYLNLDPSSELSKALTIHILVRQGKEKEALRVGPSQLPHWGSYNMLLACVNQEPLSEIVRLSNAVQPSADPELNYFAASHLAYCGQSTAALQMLRRAILGNYCSYPALDTDPFFDGLRSNPEFVRIRSSAIACQNNFLAQRAPPQ